MDNVVLMQRLESMKNIEKYTFNLLFKKRCIELSSLVKHGLQTLLAVLHHHEKP